MNKLEIQKIKSVFYSNLALLLTLSFVALAVFISNMKKLDSKHLKGLIEITVDLLEQERKIIIDEFLTGNFESSKFRVEKILSKPFKDQFQVSVVSEGSCVLEKNIKKCQKYYSYIDKNIENTSYQKINSMSFMTIPINAFNKNYGYIIVYLKTNRSEVNMTETITELFLPFVILILIWFVLYRHCTNKILLPTISKIVNARKNKDMANLANKLAHDIRSPVETLNFLAEYTEIEEESKKLLKFAIERINSISSTLLLKNQKINNTSLGVKEIVQMMERLVREKELLYPKVDFQICVTTDMSLFFSSSEIKIVFRAFENLINNSLEAFFQTSKPQIYISIESRNKDLEIIVSDNGPGIPENIQSRVMSEGHITTKENGNGLGLSGSVQALNKVGIDLKLIHSDNKGTTFQIVIPFKKGDVSSLDLGQNYSLDKNSAKECGTFSKECGTFSI